MTDGTGVTTYNYNPIALKLGSGMLGSIVGPVANSTIAYDYDELGRVKERGINGVKRKRPDNDLLDGIWMGMEIRQFVTVGNEPASRQMGSEI